MDEILNSKNLNGIRFRMAKPQGYYTEDVDNFVDGAIKKSIAAYEVKVSEQEQTIARLENQIAPMQAKISELEIKADFADASGDAQQDDALIQSIAKQEELEAQILALRSEIGEKEDYITQLNTYIDEVAPLIEAGASALASTDTKEEEPAVENVEVETLDEPVEEEVILEEVLQEDEEDTFEAYDSNDAEEEAEEEQDNNLTEEPVEVIEVASPETDDEDDEDSEEDDEEIVDVYSSFDDEYEVDAAELEKAMQGETVADSFSGPEISKSNGSVADAFGVNDDEPEVDAEALRAAMEDIEEEDDDLPERIKPEDL